MTAKIESDLLIISASCLDYGYWGGIVTVRSLRLPFGLTRCLVGINYLSIHNLSTVILSKGASSLGNVAQGFGPDSTATRPAKKRVESQPICRNSTRNVLSLPCAKAATARNTLHLCATRLILSGAASQARRPDSPRVTLPPKLPIPKVPNLTSIEVVTRTVTEELH